MPEIETTQLPVQVHLLTITSHRSRCHWLFAQSQRSNKSTKFSRSTAQRISIYFLITAQYQVIPESFVMAERYIPEHRRTQFKAKNSFKPDELRRRREEQQVEIRRQKREENLAKRRGVQRGNGEIGIGGLADADSDDEAGNIESEVSHIL